MTRDPREVLTRASRAPDVVLRYGPDPDHVIDLRLPAEQAGPLVIFLHGGFWRAAFDRSHTGPLAADLADRGYPVACVEFRRIPGPGLPLAPARSWRDMFDDVERALTALPDLVRPYADPAAPVLAGHSAGGHLALLYGGSSAVAGVVALAPVADLAAAYHAGLGDGAVGDLLGGGPDEVPERYDQVDPARRGPLPVPVVIVHGDADDRVPVSISYQYAGLVGNSCTLVVLEGANHFGVIDPLSSAWSAVRAALSQVIDADWKRR